MRIDASRKSSCGGKTHVADCGWRPDREHARRTVQHNHPVAIHVELRDEAGHVLTRLPDPSGGTFDAAGDFDRFVDSYPYDRVPGGLSVLASVDPIGDTAMPSAVMARLIADCARALALATDGPERRGLLRLRVMAEECSRRPDSTLYWTGD